MALEMMKFLKDYIAELDAKIEDAASPNSADTKAKIKTREDMQQKLSVLIGAIKTESELTRDQASNLKSAETALAELNYAGRDFDETSRFCARVDQLFDLYISNDAALEEKFCAKVKLRFKASTYSRLKSSTDKTETWKELKAWLNKTYDSGLSSLQLIQRATETNFDPNLGWKRYAADIDDRMEPARHAIMTQIRKTKQLKNPTSKLEDDCNKPEPEDCFSFFAASIIAGRLKHTKPELHSLMANEWANIADASTVATKIEFLSSQTSTNGGSVFFTSSNRSGNGWKQKNGSPKKSETTGEKDKKAEKAICTFWQRGKCTKGRDCRFRHYEKAGEKSKTLVVKTDEQELPVENQSNFFR